MKEWLITNGIGGFASSTDMGGMNTRRYHGLLVAPLNPPEQRHLILSKVDESIEIDGKKFFLYTNQVGEERTKGYKYQIGFEKEIIPIYRYKVNGIEIEKSICMVYEKNTVIVVYKIMNKKAKTRFNITPLVNFRDFHSESHEKEFEYEQNEGKDRTQILIKNHVINIAVSGSNYKKDEKNIFYGMHYMMEKRRGFDCDENHIVPGTFEVDIKPNEDKTITFACSLNGENGHSIEELLKLNGEEIIKKEANRIKEQIENSKLNNNNDNSDNNENEDKDVNQKEVYEEIVKKYIIASDNFIVKRKENGLHTIIAGYPWFLDWGRDAFIAFEGLLLISKRFEIAKEVLLTFANKIKEGLIPNGFSEYTGEALYNSVDASLLFIDAVGKYLKYTDDYKFVEEKLYGKMKNIINNYIDGITLDNNDIYLDSKDYLIVSGTEKTQNTWMDAKVNGVSVTPRNGKAVEINALWYNALKIMEVISYKLNKKVAKIEYTYLAARCKKSFQNKFYNKEKKCLYDVVETNINNLQNQINKDFDNYITDKINDSKVRPNQIFAISTIFPVLDCDKKIAKELFITVTQKLLNKYGIQTLASNENGFNAIYEGNPQERDSVYHQGITWPWLLGPYYDALKNLIQNEKDEERKEKLVNTLMQFRGNISNTFMNEITKGNTIGSICEIYDSTSQSTGKGAFAQAWSISEIFRIILET